MTIKTPFLPQSSFQESPMDAKSRWGGKFHENCLHGLEVFPTGNLLIVNNYTVEKQNLFDWVIKFNIISEGKDEHLVSR